LKYKNLVFLFITIISILPSFYIVNVSLGNNYIINTYIDKETGSQTSNQSGNNEFAISSQIIDKKPEHLVLMKNYSENNIFTFLNDFKLIAIYNQTSDNNLTYNIRAEKNDVVYHITIVISAVGGKLEGINILENEKRRKILEYLQNNPGSYMREIMRIHDLSPNEAQYHLATLERHNLIKRYRSDKFLLFYISNEDINIEQVRLNIIYKNVNYQKIYKLKLIYPNITIKEISEQTGLHRNTVGKYLKILNNTKI